MLLGVLIFLALLILLLAIPVSLIFELSWHREFQSELELDWMFGLVRVRLPSQPRMPEPSSNEETDGASQRARTGSSVIRFVRNKQFRHRSAELMRDLWRSITKKNIRLRIRAGLDDPADTGLLWAFVGPIAGSLASIQQHSIDIAPDFINAGFELEGNGCLRFSPLRIVLISMGFLLSPSIWHSAYEINKGR